MNVGIVGATGYGGVELIRLLHHHPEVKQIHVYSTTKEGEPLHKTYPHLGGQQGTLILKSFQPEEMARECDVVFLAAPAGVSAEISPLLFDTGVKIIDLSGDLRIQDREKYKAWYHREPAPERVIEEAVYGLSEWARPAIEKAKIIANPGCYPTAALTGLLPVVKKGLIDLGTLIIDAKSGVSGAGRTPSANAHFPEMNDNLKIYKVNQHQHIPEIEQMLATVHHSSEVPPVTFSTHLVPMTRGIMSTMYASLTNKGTTLEKVRAVYEEAYRDAPFVRVRDDGNFPTTRDVYGSNYCDIGLTLDERTGRLTIVSVIDNLVKGAAGQAVHNFNLMFGFDEMDGLRLLPVYP
ncbi:N-acetyl-gamma-glutamyl-phosphate reductase [Bacillaceae bacterium SIJ1]|uniref:N-acetyl-gamma-glutamyl-phosphate reductase n=1 Tax=Litoribacterium kuwaitense TaxID=1398745 RepID=UPI0013EA3918|nr:N-acetyl-gamma-glutamyl-phosphate reductase [Litoribacterium kuwaitense]NGP44548.1 N-acetyl-gamma-glutamyl-phosphate reductase [Litoribacterium kuwaitense]